MEKFRKQDMLLTKALIILMLILSLFASVLTVPNVTYAEGTSYSNVLDDLHKDENFNEDNYQVISNDHSVQIIQLAESVENRLFIYVYQPSGREDIIATSINISTSSSELDFANYKLTLINREGVFHKYIVEGFQTQVSNLRYYEITSIYREWNESLDVGLPDYTGNNIDEVAYPVSKAYTLIGAGDDLIITCQDIETIKVTSKYVGFIRYYSGWAWRNFYGDSHFIAFSTDKDMDNILEAELEFVTYDYDTLGDTPLGDPDDRDPSKDVNHHITLTNEDVVDNETVGLFGENHTWNRIETVSDFIQKEELTEETKASIENEQWVLRFYETEFTKHGGSSGEMFGHGTAVAKVTLLRLKYETDGYTYNLGVIDNIQSGSNTPSSETNNLWTRIEDWFSGLAEWLQILLIALIVLLSIPVSVFVIYAVWKILSFPFKVLKKDKGDKK